LKRARLICFALLAIACIAGSSEPVRDPDRIDIGGYQVLSADFHVHTFPGDWAVAPPWEAMLQARRDGVQVISLAGQNHIWKGRIGRWITDKIGGPIVFVGEEIVTPNYHLLAVGVEETISWRLPAKEAIEGIHSQGGVAIAAHPFESFWPAYDVGAMQILDAAEILHPGARTRAGLDEQLKAFALRGHPAAIGDSDWRFGPIGWCRTYLFVRESSEQGVLDAIRNHRTVVYDRGEWFGDKELIVLARRDGRLAYEVERSGDGLALFSRLVGVIALFGLIVFGRARNAARNAAR
jgi:hypothetical protein